ncbi:hypothetical protein BD626DRAFT_222161 [Schizophyllum amplum]|uniref:Uncharacterized protein n=1 Tax=Schizophyllum amplum TaxID=97359 RepID=A0A550BXI3_9AGAR|nr:hypothetical protein BD626DRAFT_222161 [Auriculariopsis ampla]
MAQPSPLRYCTNANGSIEYAAPRHIKVAAPPLLGREAYAVRELDMLVVKLIFRKMRSKALANARARRIAAAEARRVAASGSASKVAKLLFSKEAGRMFARRLRRRKEPQPAPALQLIHIIRQLLAPEEGPCMTVPVPLEEYCAVMYRSYNSHQFPSFEAAANEQLALGDNDTRQPGYLAYVRTAFYWKDGGESFREYLHQKEKHRRKHASIIHQHYMGGVRDKKKREVFRGDDLRRETLRQEAKKVWADLARKGLRAKWEGWGMESKEIEDRKAKAKEARAKAREAEAKAREAEAMAKAKKEAKEKAREDAKAKVAAWLEPFNPERFRERWGVQPPSCALWIGYPHKLLCPRRS